MSGALPNLLVIGAAKSGTTSLHDYLDHHPDIDLRWRTLHLSVVTHSAGAVTPKDLQLARRIDRLLA